MKSLKQIIRNCGVRLAQFVGSTIRDAETGEALGKALLLPWRGRILVIGLEARVRPFFLTQERTTYWKQTLGFSVHPKPDFPNERQK